MQRQATEVALIDIAEQVQDAMCAGDWETARRGNQQLIRALSVYARERQIVRTLERCGLDSPLGLRSLDEYRKERKRAA